MKKALKGIIVLSVAVLTLALIAGPALGWDGWYESRKQVNAGNTACVENNVNTNSYTGGNTINRVATKGGDNDGDNTIDTGNIDARAGAITVANTNVGTCCTRKQVNVRNYARVGNNVGTMSDTGLNNILDSASMGGDSDGDNTIETGDVDARDGAITVVNSDIQRGGYMR